MKNKRDVTILITIGSDYAKVNGEDVKLDSPAFVENDRTYTPIRFISGKSQLQRLSGMKQNKLLQFKELNK